MTNLMNCSIDSFPLTWQTGSAVSEQLIRRSRKSPDAFLATCFTDAHGGGIRQAAVHRELQAFLTAHRQALVELPRDHGKSVQVCGRILWELGPQPGAAREARLRDGPAGGRADAGSCATRSPATSRLRRRVPGPAAGRAVGGGGVHGRAAGRGDRAERRGVRRRGRLDRGPGRPARLRRRRGRPQPCTAGPSASG